MKLHRLFPKYFNVKGNLYTVSESLLKAGLLGSNPDGLFKPTW